MRDGISDAKLDFYDGLLQTDIEIDVRHNLSPFIVPSNGSGIPVLPNFFLDAKGPDGSAAVLKRQAFYYGTLGARGIQKVQSYGQGSF